MHALEVDTFHDEETPAPGEFIGGRYRVEELLGSGGMGRVVAARDDKGARVAIKLLIAPAWRTVLVERFFREARTVSRIDSPHVVKIIAVSRANEAMPFMVMERLDGEDFAHRLAGEGRLALRDVADCMVQACAAIASSHAIGVIHRDVKPSNLFDHRNADGTRTVKVLDFGISKARHASGEQGQGEWTLTTTRDTMLGSPPYMSPEHLRDARAVDHRTDIWSLGVVAYQLLVGRLPFEGKTVGALFCAVLDRRFTALSSARPELPAAVDAIVDRCLASEPQARFQNAAELARAFAPFASPRFAALAERMTTVVAVRAACPSVPAGAMSLASGVAEARLDGAARTMTVAPPALAPATNDDEESQAVTALLSRDSADSLPAVVAFLPVALAPTGARAVRPRRSRGFAAAAGSLLVALLVTPFAFSNARASTPIEPATAAAPMAASPDDVTFTVAEAPPAPRPTGAVRPSTPASARATTPPTPRAPKRGPRGSAERAIDTRR